MNGETKRRIDNARDVLVGKVPDPKGQVEQITLALMYRFMDNVDQISEDVGGKARFFANGYEKYAWGKLMDARQSGIERLLLYAEAIEKMSANPHLPQLFRDMFKGAFLPYRDPETLRLFLKEIESFPLEHTEELGDAYEYLLSILSSQGDAGQFRTPRHIIKFIVDVVDPKKDETVLDPACGTAGFLIDAYQHIVQANTNDSPGDLLTSDDRERLAKNFAGYDISPDMVRMSLVNMYLHGFAHPRIHEYDTLTDEARWEERFDVILANPPFMTPKGGIRPHKRFSVQANRSEVLFVDYIAEHLTPSGRAGVIVPEGIIFQSSGAYKALRKMLIDTGLIGVISLPSGVFLPYTAVKTSVLIIDREEARRQTDLLFSEVRRIGVSLGAAQAPIEDNDLPAVLADYAAYRAGGDLSDCSWRASKSEVTGAGATLVGTRFRPAEAQRGGTRFAPLGALCSLSKGSSSSTGTPPGPYPLVVRGGERLTSDKYQFDCEAVCVPSLSLTHGQGRIKRIHYASGKFALANLMFALVPSGEINAKFLYLLLDRRKEDIEALMQGAIYVTLKHEDLAAFAVPVPPLDVQQQIVDEIEGYQKVIDGARQVVENWKPSFTIDPDWPVVELGEVCDSISDGDHQPPPKAPSGVPFVTISNIDGAGEIDFTTTFFVPEEYYGRLSPIRVPRPGDVLYTVTGSYGIPVLVVGSKPFCFQRHIALLRPSRGVDSQYLYSLMASPLVAQQAHAAATGMAQKTVSLRALRAFQVPVPPIAVQQQIAAAIQTEQRAVEASRQLADSMQARIRAKMDEVWEA